jgi:hypothetical protein
MRSRRNLPTVPLVSVTDQRAAISARRSTQRQRTHLIAFNIRPFQHHGLKLRHLRVVQRRGTARTPMRTQSNHAVGIKAMHPVRSVCRSMPLSRAAASR